MKKLLLGIVVVSVLIGAAIPVGLLTGCTTTTTTSTNGVTTVTHSVDPATIAILNQAAIDIASNAPADIAIAQSIQAMVKGTNK